MGRDAIHQTRFLKAPSNLALNSSRHGTPTSGWPNEVQMGALQRTGPPCHGVWPPGLCSLQGHRKSCSRTGAPALPCPPPKVLLLPQWPIPPVHHWWALMRSESATFEAFQVNILEWTQQSIRAQKHPLFYCRNCELQGCPLTTPLEGRGGNQRVSVGFKDYLMIKNPKTALKPLFGVQWLWRHFGLTAFFCITPRQGSVGHIEGSARSATWCWKILTLSTLGEQ